jgi:hypothetical protein
MILTARIASKGIKRLRKEILRRTGVKLLYSSRVKDIFKHNLHFRYGFSLPLPSALAHKDTQRNSPEAINFLKNKKIFADYLLEHGYLAPRFRRDTPEESDYPLIIRETLYSFGGRGMLAIRTPEEFQEWWNPSYYWCSYIPTKSEYRFHVGNPLEGEPRIIRCMKKVPRTEEISQHDVQIRHVDEYHYSKRFDPYEKFPKWSKQITNLASILPGWLYSLDVGVTPELRLVFFEANTASGIDNGCARDYADFIIPELDL